MCVFVCVCKISDHIKINIISDYIILIKKTLRSSKRFGLGIRRSRVDLTINYQKSVPFTFLGSQILDL